MKPATAPAETRPQTQREELNAALHYRYLGYVLRLERWDKSKGWVKYTVCQPLASLASMARNSGLPDEWCRQPLSESEWLGDVFLGRLRNLPD